MVVQKGDTIEFSKDKMPTETIVWQQNFVDKKEDFYAIAFTIAGKTDGGVLYLQQSYSKELIGNAKEVEGDPFGGGKSYQVQVTDKFQYGQDQAANPSVRFLVYQNHDNKPYQHRFMSTTTFGGAMNKVASIGKVAPAVVQGVLNQILSLGKAYVGDPLRSF